MRFLKKRFVIEKTRFLKRFETIRIGFPFIFLGFVFFLVL